MTRLAADLGFTLVEVVVVVALITLMAAFVYPISATVQAEHELETVASAIVQTLREAQAKAMTGDRSSRWGVYFDDDPAGNNDRFVLFLGTTYAARDANFDQVTDLSDELSFRSITLSGGSSVVFSQLRGTTANAGSVQLSAVNGGSRTIRVNAAGVVDLE